jgi:hypothetical protein
MSRLFLSRKIEGGLDAATAVMTSESCVLTLRYALWHVGANALLVAGLAWAGETHTFFSAHIFGLFALLADFGVFYLHAGTINAPYGRPAQLTKPPRSTDKRAPL